LLYSLHVLQDVTEKRKSGHRLKLFRALVDHANDMIDVFDPETMRCLDVNDTACRTLGYSRDELLSMTAYDINPTLTKAMLSRSER
jgi:PAS domain S-box-containing protein